MNSKFLEEGRSINDTYLSFDMLSKTLIVLPENFELRARSRMSREPMYPQPPVTRIVNLSHYCGDAKVHREA